MNWMIDILVTHRRLRGLTEAQLRELIELTNDLDALRAIKEHLERRDFRYPTIELSAGDMAARCVERAKDILWQRQAEKLREMFFEKIGDPFA